jgi:hypothetical protein
MAKNTRVSSGFPEPENPWPQRLRVDQARVMEAVKPDPQPGIFPAIYTDPATVIMNCS